MGAPASSSRYSFPKAVRCFILPILVCTSDRLRLSAALNRLEARWRSNPFCIRGNRRVSCALTFACWHHVLLGRTPGEEANDEHVSDQDPLGN
jgi:hypothetical protein